MKKLIVLLVAMSLPMMVQASSGHNEYLVDAPINLDDKASLQKGAQIFVNNCLGCHSAKYMRYERVSDDLEIPADIMMENLMFTTNKIGDVMNTAMPVDLAKKWFGTAPPDLTLEARARGSDWLYSYLISFYADESRPFGVNNHIFKDVGMPHVLQTMQESMGEDEFKTNMADLTNYMVYTAEPIRAERERLGYYVIGFLFILLIPVYFLNKEFWKDID
ncbi:MAG: cytochrome C [Moraxellaceae bacterium]|nr:MAG: cytochrome C [Moraxellaceae bacterium]